MVWGNVGHCTQGHGSLNLHSPCSLSFVILPKTRRGTNPAGVIGCNGVLLVGVLVNAWSARVAASCGESRCVGLWAATVFWRGNVAVGCCGLRRLSF